MSPSSKSQPKRSDNLSAMVLLPEPDTPITTSAQGILPVSSPTKILRQRRLIDQPDGRAGGARAVRREILPLEHARQDRALVGARGLEQHFAAGGGDGQGQGPRGHTR